MLLFADSDGTVGISERLTTDAPRCSRRQCCHVVHSPKPNVLAIVAVQIGCKVSNFRRCGKIFSA